MPAVTPELAIAIVTGAEPLNDVPESPVPIVKVLVVLAVTVIAPPKLTELPLTVIELLVNELLPMLVNVFVEPLIVLFVNVSVVALPTKVSVLVGRVNVPLLTIVEITGEVNVLFVNICVPVSVATVESMAMVTGAEPLNEVPVSPVPMVKVLVVLAVTVVDPPKLTEFPLIVMELFAS